MIDLICLGISMESAMFSCTCVFSFLLLLSSFHNVAMLLDSKSKRRDAVRIQLATIPTIRVSVPHSKV